MGVKRVRLGVASQSTVRAWCAILYNSRMNALGRMTGAWIALLVVIAGLAAMAACNFSPAAVPTATPTNADSGRATFASTCAACHGALGEGQPNWHIRQADGTLPAPPLNGTGHTWHHADGLLYRIVSVGGALWEAPSLPDIKSGMPGFGEQLSREEIIAVLEYVKSLWGDREVRGASIVEQQALISGADPYPPPDVP